eukprot:300891-Chlamydomonas_euryale.AAC.5
MRASFSKLLDAPSSSAQRQAAHPVGQLMRHARSPQGPPESPRDHPGRPRLLSLFLTQPIRSSSIQGNPSRQLPPPFHPCTPCLDPRLRRTFSAMLLLALLRIGLSRMRGAGGSRPSASRIASARNTEAPCPRCVSRTGSASDQLSADCPERSTPSASPSPLSPALPGSPPAPSLGGAPSAACGCLRGAAGFPGGGAPLARRSRASHSTWQAAQRSGTAHQVMVGSEQA